MSPGSIGGCLEYEGPPRLAADALHAGIPGRFSGQALYWGADEAGLKRLASHALCHLTDAPSPSDRSGTLELQGLYPSKSGAS